MNLFRKPFDKKLGLIILRKVQKEYNYWKENRNDPLFWTENKVSILMREVIEERVESYCQSVAYKYENKLKEHFEKVKDEVFRNVTEKATKEFAEKYTAELFEKNLKMKVSEELGLKIHKNLLEFHERF